MFYYLLFWIKYCL